MEKVRTLVVGAGITGLATAAALAERGDDDYVILEGDSQIGETTIIAERCFHLRSQLASRLQHQTPEGAVFSKQRQDGKRKSCGLTGTCLRSADQIFTGKDNGKRA